MIKILGLSFAGRLVDVLEMGLGLINSELEVLEDIVSIGFDFIGVFDIFVLVMPGAPCVEMAVLAVLNLDYHWRGCFHWD